MPVIVVDSRPQGNADAHATLARCAGKIGPWQTYKRGVETDGDWFDPPLRISDRKLDVPKRAGCEITDPDEILKGAAAVKS